MIAITRDITERKNTEDLQRVLLDSLPHPAMIIDEDRIIRASNAIAREIGAVGDTFCWKEFGKTNYITKEDKEMCLAGETNGIKCTFCLADQAIQEEGELTTEVHAFGRTWDVYWKYIGKDENGKSIYLHYLVDITGKQKTLEALRVSEERFRRSILESPFPIMLHAEDGEVLQINKIWTELTGYAPEEIPTLSAWTERAYGEKNDVTKSRIDKIFDCDTKVEEGEYVITSKDGKTLIWDFSSAPLGKLPDGRRLVISMAIDVSERKRLQKALMEKEEAILQETGLVLHEELAQTLVSAKMKSELAYNTLEKDSPEAEHIREVTEAIKQAIVDTRNMSNTLFPLQLQHLGLTGALDQLAVEMKNRYGIDCRFEYDEKAVSIEDNTALQFYRIAQQAIDNAGQHGNQNGRDGLKVRVGLTSENERITLTIRDNGVGFQVSPEAGIGIKHMNYRANTIGASFDIKSEKGKGTTVTVSCCRGDYFFQDNGCDDRPIQSRNLERRVTH